MAALADDILHHISKRTYKAVKPKALARKLGVRQSDYQRFRQVLKELANDGRLTLGKNHTIEPAKPHGTVVGIFRKNAAGFGFVRPHATEALAGQDVFIKSSNVGDASTGDEVLVRVLKSPRRADKGPEGEIIRVVERATHQFVGTYFEADGEGYVRVDGTTFNEPIYVGDPGAKGARENDKVVFEMIRFPAPAMRGEGVLTDVLGPRGEPGVDTLSIIRAFELPDEFPPDVLEEARGQADAFDENDLDGREDLTNETIITIDPVDARDFDDAISLTYDGHKKHWLLGVHIADVAHFVRPGGMLDREARNRGNSVYLPRRVLPMFPEIISNGLASLQQGRVRYVKSAFMEFTHTGQRVCVRFANAAIKVVRRFTYEQVSAILEEAPDGSNNGRQRGARHLSRLEYVEPEVMSLLQRMHEFAKVLRARRFKRGALELNMPETELEFDDQGRLTGAHLAVNDASHQIIEAFMLSANEAVAEHLAEHGAKFIRRTHPAPDPRKLRDFADFAIVLGYDVDVRRAADRFQLQRLLQESADQPEAPAMHYALLRSLKQAEYSPAEDGHYALASDTYTHFTSPIRRYPDLTVHRQLDQWLRTGRIGGNASELVALGEHCSFTERRADQAERELIKMKLLDYLKDRIGMELEIMLTGVQEYGFFGQAPTFPVEGFVHVSSLVDDYYYYDASSHSLVGRRTKRRFRLGDKVKVQVARVDLDRRHLDFRVAAEKKPAKHGKKEA